MRENEILYSVLAICITILLVALGYFNSRTEEKRLDLFVECLYSSQGVVDPVERCRAEIPNIIRWEDELDDELDEPEDLMDGGK
jgi:hypothetical protein